MQQLIGILCLLGGLAAGPLAATPSATALAAAAEKPATLQPQDPAPADTLRHRVQAGDTLAAIAGRHRAAAGWYSRADCLTAIRRANGLQHSDLLRIGQVLRIPRHQAPPPPRVGHRVAAGAPLRGLYLPAGLCARQTVLARVDSFVAAGGNAVVFDAKDIDGGVSFRSGHPLAVWGKGRHAPLIPDLDDLVARLQARGLHVVARLALFLDGELGHRRPDLALQDSTGAPWTERGCVWLDPAAPEVADYHATLARELVRAGVDEVQIDYVRFPTNGWRGDWQGDLAATAARRRAVITAAVAALHDTVTAAGCQLSADLFGIMAWGRTADLALTGQHVPSLARHLDVICPMIYPSHFGPGFDGLPDPAAAPEAVITAGVRRFREQAGPRVAVRPWLQAFPWRVADYGPGYVAVQIAAARAAGATGWCLWNPAGRYDRALAGVAAAVATPVGAPPPVLAAAVASGPPTLTPASAPPGPPASHETPAALAPPPPDLPGHAPAGRWTGSATAPSAARSHHHGAPRPSGPLPR
jgi:hypothetical protein